MKSYAYVAACCVTKHGVIGMTRGLVLETVKNSVVIVDTICPGYTETALTECAIENIAQKTSCFRDDAYNKLLRNNPQKRFIQHTDIANTIIILDTYKYLNSLVRGNNDIL